MPTRPQEEFPTRQYAYSGRAGLESVTAVPDDLEAGAVYRFVLGRDRDPLRMTVEDIRQTLHDPFARLVLAGGRSPQTARALLASLAADAEAEGLPVQRVFVVADGGQIPWTEATANLERAFRFLISRARGTELPTLFVATSPAFDSDSTFLQVVGWDAVAGAYQFYDRRHGAWVWAGSSWEALAPDSRGQGPFDSHVNGALNMKELKQPWIHWHSMAARIRDDALAPDDPLRTERLWQDREPAERLEVEIIRPGILRWNEARLGACRAGDQLTRLPEFFRQVLDTSTVNLVCSPQESRRLRPGMRVTLPLTFFINSDALVDVLGLDPGITEVPTVDAGVYLECLRRYEVAIADSRHRFPGDTHFAFAVPEPAFEDVAILQSLRRLNVLSDKLAACMLMVDFANPVFSRRRAALLAYVPERARVGAAGDFGAVFVAAVERAAQGLPGESAEHEFLASWALPETTWRRELEARLRNLFAGVRERLASFDSFAPLFELAESRRREFRRRPLAEFRLTVPLTNIPEDAPLLELTPDARVRPKP
jgi:hypothetical protein